MQETSFHIVRGEQFFRPCKDFKVMTLARALSSDRKAKTVPAEAVDQIMPAS